MGLNSLPVLIVPDPQQAMIGVFLCGPGFLLASLLVAWSLEWIRPLPRFLTLFAGTTALAIVQFCGVFRYDLSAFFLFLMIVFAVGACIEAHGENRTVELYLATGDAVLATVMYYAFLSSIVSLTPV